MSLSRIICGDCLKVLPTLPVAARVAAANRIFGEFSPHRASEVESDVLNCPRVCGTYKERRKWAATQHPEALIERMVKMSCRPWDLVLDLFAHSGTTLRVCRRLGIDCIGIELSRFYCEKIAEETGAELVDGGSV